MRRRSTEDLSLPADLTLLEADGSPAPFALPAPGRLEVVQLVRYFGCLPCQDWLVELDRLRPELELRGASPAAVGGSADYQAQYLKDERGVQMPIYLDPTHAFRDAVDMTRPLGLKLANPRGAAAYVGSLRRGFRPQKITKDTVRSPGVVIVDSHGAIKWRYEGTRIGDYPPHAEVLAALEKLAPAAA
ncbi:hypothetical protein C6I20_14970 [Aeromicrobium sp. A1-2]|uniref:AhpC/TSA family protein n=1 Tax=Aeromicrobium sp. A1-2 TaxID=2107713 RepID=UPI000E48A652|nr:AhpC/TSA family protein [Aeromicrobium sp. A1-2]AXT86349.1 hypothetical protein C6I20_14970 [Aeromicrobium sp. A1-2]